MSQVFLKAALSKSDSYLLIRTAKAEDAAQLLPFLREALREELHTLVHPDILTLPLEDEVRWIENHARFASNLLLVAVHDSELVGILDYSEGELGVFVSKPFREDGVGHMLLTTFLDWGSRHAKTPEVITKFRTNNRSALLFFERHGFVVSPQSGLTTNLASGTTVMAKQMQ